MSETIFGGRKADVWEGVIPFPLADGTDYELPVVLRPLYKQNRNTIMGKNARYKKKSGMPYFHLSDTDRLNAALLNFVLRGWGDANRNPVGFKCQSCNLWVISKDESKFYEIAHCECKQPEITDSEGNRVGTRLPHDRMWPLYVIHQLEEMVDESRMPVDDDGDPKRAIDLILDKANELAYPNSNAFEREDDDATDEEVREIEEGNSPSSPDSVPSTAT